MKHALIFLAGLLSAVVLACGDSQDEGEPPDITAEEVLEQASAAAADVTSFQFELTHENGTTPLPMGLQLQSANGVVAVPGSVQTEVDARAAGITVTVEIIGVDGETWVTNPFTRRWEQVGGADIRDFADPEAIVERVLPLVEDPELHGTSSINGVRSYELHGTIDSGVLREAIGVAEPGRTVEVEAWFGEEDMLPRRVRLIGALADGEASNVVRQVDLSNFNEPVSIEPPE